jgi:hypothetical protein
MRMTGALRFPDFVIGGAPRAGTTWLYWLLDRHPGIYMARPVAPEPKFFLEDDEYEKGLRHYSERWFAEAPETKVAGEKSTNYLESAVAAERMARDLPRLKLVFILREPADRAFSNYVWSRMHGHETEELGAALRLEDERQKDLPAGLRFARPFSYFTRGLYAELLAPYFDRFPREQILVLRFEDIGRPAAHLAERLHQFLGVSPRPGDAGQVGAVNKSEKGGVTFDEETRRALRARYVEPNRRLAMLLGPDFEPWHA